jgi:hypothetical protein
MGLPLTVRIKPPGVEWVVAGTEDQKGYTPEAFTATSNQWGSDTCGFNLRRDPKVPYLDLAPFSVCEVEIGGMLVWSGRVWETPASDPYSIGVSGKGWQYHLDDDLTQAAYVYADLTQYVDQRSIATSNQGVYTSVWPAPATDAAIVLSIPGTPALTVPINTETGVTLDLGYTPSALRISVDWDCSNNDASITFRAATHNLPSEWDSPNWFQGVGFALNTGASGTTSGTFATPERYVTLLLEATVAHAVPAAGVYLRISGARIYTSTAYESGGASILHASDVVKAELAHAPLLNQTDLTKVNATTFAIPMLADPTFQTARTRINAANAYHDWQTAVDVERRMVFRSFPTVPLYEAGGAAGVTFVDATLNSGQDVYNKVIVQGAQPDGTLVNEVRTSSSTLLTRQGFTRAFALGVNAAITPAAADALGDAWLASRTRTPLSGTLTVTGDAGVRMLLGGAPVHPAQLLLAPGEKIRLSDRADPDDGSWGRDGTISTVTYSHDGEKADVAIDSPRDRFDALLAQIGAIEQAVGL